jgi:hypothetical protein
MAELHEMTKPVGHDAPNPKRTLLAGVFLLFWLFVLMAGVVGMLHVWRNDGYSFPESRGPGFRLHFLLVQILGLLFAAGGIFSAVRFGRGGRWSVREVLAVAVGCLFGGLILYVWVFA